MNHFAVYLKYNIVNHLYFSKNFLKPRDNESILFYVVSKDMAIAIRSKN